MKGIRTLAGLVALLAVALASPASAQFNPGDDVPEIAAARQAVFDAPFGEKSPRSEKLLALIAKHFGERSAEYAGELQLHASNLQMENRPRDAQRANERAVAILAAIYPPDSAELALSKHHLAVSLVISGFRDESLEPYGEFVAAITEVAYGCGRIDGNVVLGCSHDAKGIASYLLGYANVFHDLGRTDDGKAVFERALARFQPRWDACETDEWGFDCASGASEKRAILSEYAKFLAIAGDPRGAIGLLEEITVPRLEALAGCGDEACAADYWLLSDYRQYADTLYDYDVALGLEADAAWLPVLRRQPIHDRAGTADADIFDDDYVEVLETLLADFAGRASEAGHGALALAVLEPLGKADLVRGQEASADHDAKLAALREELDTLGYGEDARIAEVNRQIVALQSARFGEQSREVAEAQREVALALRFDQPAEASEWFVRSLETFRAAEGDGDFRTHYALDYLAGHLERIGQPMAVLPYLEAVMAAPANDHMAVYLDPIRASAMNNGLLNGDEKLNELKARLAGLLLRRGGSAQAALDAARHAAVGMRAWRQSLGLTRSDQNQLALADADWGYGTGARKYPSYFALYADALWSGTGDRQGVHDEAFLALQEATMDATSKAVAEAAAQRALARGNALDLIRQRDALDAELSQMIGMIGVSTGGGLTDVVGRTADARAADRQARANAEYQRSQRDLSAAIARKEFARDELTREIMEAAPGYFELIRPQPLSIEEAQELIGPDEGFLLVVPTKFGTHSLLVSDAGISWHRSALGEAELNPHVRRLLWDLGASIEVSYGERITWEAEGEGEFPFDRGTAHLMYRELVAPHAEALRGKRHLFVAAGGSLSSLPFSVFVTEEPTGNDGDPAALRATDWLGDAHAIVQLPSLQSLQLLRAVEDAGASETDLLLGFGDPVLDGEAVSRGTDVNQRLTRASGLPVRQAFSYGSPGTKRLADPGKLRELARLPGTRTELQAMGRVFGERNSAIYLADDATEAAFYSADLDRASVISFATHGLIAGEVDGVVEPGLVFTPPQDASNENDGLLSASEVTGLTLNADWVILSACNTASGDGSDGAPGLSGLARSFFFAGAKSLLASHWPVKDDVAAIMTVRILELQKADPRLSRAEALQAAMREIREDTRDDGKATWAHPSAWAPFAYIGDIR